MKTAPAGGSMKTCALQFGGALKCSVGGRRQAGRPPTVAWERSGHQPKKKG